MKPLILSTFVVTVLLSGCSVKNKMNDMHDDTRNMRQQTSKLGETTDDMKDLTSVMFTTMKPKDAAQMRQQAIELMEKAKSLTKKTLEATKFFYSFEFQLSHNVENTELDYVALREDHKFEAMIEFLKTTKEYLKGSERKWSLNSTSKSNEMKNLYALAATMHKKNSLQKKLLATFHDENIKEISFFDVVKEGLDKNIAMNAGEVNREDLSRLEQESFREKNILIYMLKLRYKVLPVIALARMSHIEDGLLEKIDMLYTKKWDMKSNLNTEELDYLSDIFDQQEMTKNFLESIGESVESVDKKVLKIYRHMDMKKSFYSEVKINGADSENARAQMKLKAHIELFLQVRK